MATFRILLPYNYSPNDQKAIRFTIDAFAGRKDVRITLFHAYTPLPTIDVTASPKAPRIVFRNRVATRVTTAMVAVKVNNIVLIIVVTSGWSIFG